MKYLKMFKKLQINIRFVKAIAHVPYYAKFLMEIMANKNKLEEYAMVALTEECSAVLQDNLPPKLKDLGSFTIPCSISNVNITRSLYELGASVNMSSPLFKKLRIGELVLKIVSD